MSELDHFAKTFSKLLQAGDIVFLEGEMGSGKTTLISAICKGMGLLEDVTSPTYAVKHEYINESLEIEHYDLFKVREGDFLYQMALENFPESTKLTFVEWPENLPDSLKNVYDYKIIIEKTSTNNDSRIIEVN